MLWHPAEFPNVRHELLRGAAERSRLRSTAARPTRRATLRHFRKFLESKWLRLYIHQSIHPSIHWSRASPERPRIQQNPKIPSESIRIHQNSLESIRIHQIPPESTRIHENPPAKKTGPLDLILEESCPEAGSDPAWIQFGSGSGSGSGAESAERKESSN